jgi:hypothetical protein
MSVVLGKFAKFVVIYLDDITIFSKTFYEHVEHVRQVFDALHAVGLRVNLDKCSFFAKEVKLLGHIVSGMTISMDPEKIDAISKRTPPTNVKQLQQFIGLCNYYRKFVKDFSKTAAPLNKLLKKDEKWSWDNDCKQAFENLKSKLVDYPILRQPDFSSRFILYTDASLYALGAILSQKDKESGKEYVCCYVSRTLRGAELIYGITEKECLAIIWGVKQFDVYLSGVEFDIVTDHSALTWLNKSTIKNKRLIRWGVYLMAYKFNIIYRKGRVHQNADALSRPVEEISKIEEIVDEDDTVDNYKNIDPYENDALMYYLKMNKHMSGLSRKRLNLINRLANHFKLVNETLYYRDDIKGNFNLEVPKIEARTKIIEDNHLLGHFQVDSTVKRIKEQYYWKSMHRDVKRYIQNCLACNRHRQGRILTHPARSTEIV